MNRYFIEIAYNGSPFHGWQVQPNAITVQELLDKALSTICRQPISTTGCGRTDTGVHASQFYAHFDVADQPSSPADLQSTVFLQGVNALLPFEIAALAVFPVAETAHARFDATLREYEYHLHFHKDPFKHQFSWWNRFVPDVDLMNAAAQLLLEYRDFECFSKVHTQVQTTICQLSRAEWSVLDDGLVFHISADRFLRNMVRAIVGTLLLVGYRKIEIDDVRKIIESKQRSNAGASVPACGLYLTRVVYPYLLSHG